MPKQIWRPNTLISPVPPAMVSCGTVEEPNIITVAWTGVVNSDPPMTYISVRPQRYSHGLISASGEFVINLTTRGLVRVADICGVKSGRDFDKFTELGLTPLPASTISAPLIAESPVSFECRVEEVKPLGSHDMFIARITAVQVDEELIDKSGKLRLDRAGLAAFAHGEYYALGERLGTFGFSVRKKPQRRATDRAVHTKPKK